MVVNEGAGLAVDFEGRRLYTLAVGEKGVFRFKRARARGRRATLRCRGSATTRC